MANNPTTKKCKLKLFTFAEVYKTVVNPVLANAGIYSVTIVFVYSNLLPNSNNNLSQNFQTKFLQIHTDWIRCSS
jgi:hypothetical protein